MGKHIDEVWPILHDYEKVGAQLGKELQNNPVVYMLAMVAKEKEWDQLHALKASIVALAAQNRDLIEALVRCEQLRPTVIDIDMPSDLAKVWQSAVMRSDHGQAL